MFFEYAICSALRKKNEQQSVDTFKPKTRTSALLRGEMSGRGEWGGSNAGEYGWEGGWKVGLEGTLLHSVKMLRWLPRSLYGWRGGEGRGKKGGRCWDDVGDG